MGLYIKGASCISPQNTFDQNLFLGEIKDYNTNRLSCVEPDYASFFDPGSLRRMGKLMKYGTASGLTALNNADVQNPGAISTGTGWGLPEISQKFLKSLIEAGETTVSPTAFIQSTHNTVSSNIALLRKSHAHNNTFSQKGHSFESALLDAFLLSNEGVKDILVGAYDEVSDYKYAALNRAGHLRSDSVSLLESIRKPGHGIFIGEGAAFFVLTPEKEGRNSVMINGLDMFKGGNEYVDVAKKISNFLSKHNFKIEDIDLLISGVNGDMNHDAIFHNEVYPLFENATVTGFKNLCGEFMTASAFSLWFAYEILKGAPVPQETILLRRESDIKTIMICNRFQNDYSLMLLSHV